MRRRESISWARSAVISSAHQGKLRELCAEQGRGKVSQLLRTAPTTLDGLLTGAQVLPRTRDRLERAIDHAVAEFDERARSR